MKKETNKKVKWVDNWGKGKIFEKKVPFIKQVEKMIKELPGKEECHLGQIIDERYKAGYDQAKRDCLRVFKRLCLKKKSRT